ncbi:MAG: UvrD-helicase domain-containing protein [Anaerolineaceae bacterium]
MQFSKQQIDLINTSSGDAIFVEGFAGSGKTTASVERLISLIHAGISPQSVLVLVPQRSLGIPYRAATQAAELAAAGDVSILTMGGLAQRMISLFWPMLGVNAGFIKPTRPPQFLTLETAQYYLAQIISPLLQKGFFESITIDPNRIFSQVLDNLNKAAVVGFEISEIALRLRSAWSGATKQSIVYDQVQECALQFRQFCLEQNLLDYSLQFEIFSKHLWPSTLCQNYLRETFRHLIYDNIEEDVPVSHDIVKTWLPSFESAVLIQDSEGGFRTFMGADRTSAQTLSKFCAQTISFSGSFVQSPSINIFEEKLSHAIIHHKSLKTAAPEMKNAFKVHPFRFYPQAIAWITSEIERFILVEKVTPDQIVVLTPFLSDSLRFSIGQHFSSHSIPFSTFRPSRSLKDEPAVKAMLTFAKLAHPAWGLKPSRHELRYALMQTIPEADLIRADLVSQILFTPSREDLKIGSFSQIRTDMQQRITFAVGNKVDRLKEWLENSSSNISEDLDTFFSRLFGEILSQSDFSFHNNFESASVINRMIDSCRKFRTALSLSSHSTELNIGKEYLQMVEQGVIAAQFLGNWQEQSKRESVLIAPAFTYLMSNQPSEIQFWLDIGSNGWWARLDQPLTQPYILNRNWNGEQKWTNQNEMAVNQETLLRVTNGLLRRCSKQVNLISVGMNESGIEERGALLVAVQTVLRGLSPELEESHV